MKKLFISMLMICLSFTLISCNEKNINQQEQVVSEALSDNIESASEEVTDTAEKNDVNKEDEAKKAKEAFAKLLKDKAWLCTNTYYDEGNDVAEFSLLDINKDGIPELLIYCINTSTESSRKGIVISYSDGKIETTELGAKYDFKCLEKESSVYITSGNNGYTNGYQYVLENGKMKEILTWRDNLGNAGADNKVYEINQQSVSEDEYKKIIDKYENSVDISFYPINDENIEKYIGIKPKAEPVYIPTGDEKIENIQEYNRVIDLAISPVVNNVKFNKNDKNYIFNVSFTEGTLYYGDDTFEGLVATKKDSSPYVIISPYELFYNKKEKYDAHVPANEVFVAWAKLRDDGIWEVRGEYLFGFQVKDNNASIISNYDSQSKQVDDSCILVYPDGTVKNAGKINPNLF
ncbi:hypothetical protein [Clostridium butyricum]|uniref:hypothetical protein n=1 Tax=Clostridium butyricum TaxID=1492 RepID=UPI002AB2130C|nr:hypothetical protein [Clostridium butyricum]